MIKRTNLSRIRNGSGYLLGGTSAIAMLAAALVAAPAAAQQATPGSPQCPLTAGTVTCTGDIHNGFRSVDDAAVTGILFRDLTQPIAPPASSPVIDIQAPNSLDVEFRSGVIINATSPISGLSYPQTFINQFSNPPGQIVTQNTRVEGAVVLKFDPSRASSLALRSAADIDVRFDFAQNSFHGLSGALFVHGAANVDLVNSGHIKVTSQTVSGSVANVPSAQPMGIYVDHADRASVLNSGSITMTGSVGDAILVGARDVSVTNSGSIAIEGNAFEMKAVNARAVATAAAAAKLAFVNSGTIANNATPFYSGLPGVDARLLQIGRGMTSFANSGSIARTHVSIRATGQGAEDDIAILIDNDGPLTDSDLSVEVGALSMPGSVTEFSDAVPEEGVLPDKVDVDLTNRAALTRSLLGIRAEGRDVRINLVNRGDLTESGLSAESLTTTAGNALTILDNEGDILVHSTDDFGTAISARSDRFVRLTNKGAIRVENIGQTDGAAVGLGIAVEQGRGNDPYFFHLCDTVQILCPPDPGLQHFQDKVDIANSGTIDIVGQEDYNRAVSVTAFADINFDNDGAITLQGSRLKQGQVEFGDGFDLAGVVLDTYSDVVFNSRAPITLTVGDDEPVGAAILLVERSHRPSVVDRDLANTFLHPSYDREADINSLFAVNLTANVAANGRDQFGIFAYLGLSDTAAGTREDNMFFDDFVFENDKAKLAVSVPTGVSITGGTGIGSAIAAEGAGIVTVTNAGSIIGRGGAQSAAIHVSSSAQVDPVYQRRGDFPENAIIPLVFQADRFITLRDSLNTGTIRSDSGYGIWAELGAITNFTNRGLVFGGAGSVRALKASSILNDSGGTLDGRILLEGAGSTLTNSGVVQTSSPGFVTHQINGDFIQSASGTLNLRGGASGRDVMNVTGNFLLNGELNLALGAPSASPIITVGGNLTLDGRLNATDGGGFGEGVYRLFDYGGTLTDNGLVPGTLPGATSATIQTSIAHQVNIVFGGSPIGSSQFQFWDGADGVADGEINGGSGTWNATSSNWTTVQAQPNDIWRGHFAVFQRRGGTVTIDAAGIAAEGLQFAFDGYRIEGGQLNLSAPATLRAGDGSAAGASISATIASVIAGSGGIDKTDLGTLILTGANTYSGGTRVSSGRLQIGADSALGAASGGVTLDGGALAIASSFSTARGFTLGAGGGTIDTGAATFGITGNVGGPGALTKTGSGTLMLSGANGYAGGTRVNGGTLQVGADTALGAASGGITLDGGALAITASFSTARGFTLAAGGGTIDTGNSTFGMTGTIGGPGALTKTGSGTLMLSGANGYAGGTRVNGGTLQLATDTALGATNGGVTLDGGTLGIAASFSTARGFTLAAGGGTIDTGAATFGMTGAVGGPGALTKIGSGTLMLSGANSYSGGTRVRGGTLQVGADSVLGAASGGVTLDGGTLAIASSFSTARGFTVAAGGGTIDTGSFTFGLTGAVGGAGALTKTGTGTLALGGSANVIGGRLMLANGTLRLDGAPGGTLRINGDYSQGPSASLTLRSDSSGRDLMNVAGNFLLDGDLNLALGAPSLSPVITVGGNLSLDGRLNVSDAGGFGQGVYRLFDYGGALTDNGLMLSTLPGGVAGAVQTSIAHQVNLVVGTGSVQFWDGAGGVADGVITGGSGIWSASGTNWTNEQGLPNDVWGGRFAIFQRQGGTVTIEPAGIGAQGLQFAVDGYRIEGGQLNLSAPATLRVGDGSASGANMSAIIASVVAGSGGIAKTDLGTLILTGANTYAGGTRVSGGVVQVGADSALGAASGGVTLDGGTLRSASSFSTARGFTIAAGGGTIDTGAETLGMSGALGGTGALTKTGTGTLTLSGSATAFGGSLTLANGALKLGDAPGSTLRINGDYSQSATGSLTLRADSGGRDLMNVAGNFLLNGDLNLALRAPSSSAVINVGGNLTLDGRLNVSDAGGFGQGVYRLFDYGGALTDNGLVTGTLPGGVAGAVQTSIAHQVNLVIGGGPVQFWDGAGGIADGVINGGSGSWNTTGNNWTNETGLPNNVWGGRFAVFQRQAGTVTIDPAGIGAQGLQFAVDGYRIEGGQLNLSAPATLRVGDGSAGGANMSGTIASVIAGSGGIDKTDLGTLILSGANTYSSGTRVSGGRLQVGADNALGAASGGVTLDGGTLGITASFSTARGFTIAGGGGTIDTGAANLGITGALGGSGALTKIGAGTLTLGGSGSGFGGTLTLAGGAIRLDSTLGGTLQVNAGTRLSGTGSLNNLILAGTIAPGNSIGTLNASGNVTFRAGSTFELEIAAAGGADRLAAAGTATIEGGTVRVTTLDPETQYVDGRRYTFLTAAGGRSGQFASLAETSAFLDFTLGYDATSAFVTTKVIRTFPEVAATFNQEEASTALAAFGQTAGSDSLAAYNAILMLDGDAARAAFDAASGEFYPVLLATALRRGAGLADRLLARSNAGVGEGWGLWGGAEGHDGRVDGDGNGARYSRNGIGGMLGIDYRGAGNSWAAGMGGGYTHDKAELPARSSSAEGDGWNLGGYARYGTGGTGFTLAASAGYAHGDADVTRNIAVGTISRIATSTVTLSSVALAAEARYGFPLGGGWSAGPSARIGHVRAELGSFAEAGANSLDLSGGRDNDEGRTQIGGGLFARLENERGSFDLAAGYSHGGNSVTEIGLVMAGAPTQGYRVRAAKADGEAFSLAAGGEYEIGSGWSIGAHLDARFGGEERSIAGSAVLGWRF